MNQVLATATAVGILGATALSQGAIAEELSFPFTISEGEAYHLIPTSNSAQISQVMESSEEAAGIDDELLIDDELPGALEVREVEVYL